MVGTSIGLQRPGSCLPRCHLGSIPLTGDKVYLILSFTTGRTLHPTVGEETIPQPLLNTPRRRLTYHLSLEDGYRLGQLKVSWSLVYRSVSGTFEHGPLCLSPSKIRL